MRSRKLRNRTAHLDGPRAEETPPLSPVSLEEARARQRRRFQEAGCSEFSGRPVSGWNSGDSKFNKLKASSMVRTTPVT